MIARALVCAPPLSTRVSNPRNVDAENSKRKASREFGSFTARFMRAVYQATALGWEY